MEVGSFSFGEAAGWVRMNDRSVRTKLDALVNMGILSKEGRTSVMHYMLLDPFRDIRKTNNAVGIGPDHDKRETRQRSVFRGRN